MAKKRVQETPTPASEPHTPAPPENQEGARWLKRAKISQELLQSPERYNSKYVSIGQYAYERDRARAPEPPPEAPSDRIQKLTSGLEEIEQLITEAQETFKHSHGRNRQERRAAAPAVRSAKQKLDQMWRSWIRKKNGEGNGVSGSEQPSFERAQRARAALNVLHELMKTQETSAPQRTPEQEQILQFKIDAIPHVRGAGIDLSMKRPNQRDDDGQREVSGRARRPQRGLNTDKPEGPAWTRAGRDKRAAPQLDPEGVPQGLTKEELTVLRRQNWEDIRRGLSAATLSTLDQFSDQLTAYLTARAQRKDAQELARAKTSLEAASRALQEAQAPISGLLLVDRAELEAYRDALNRLQGAYTQALADDARFTGGARQEVFDAENALISHRASFAQQFRGEQEGIPAIDDLLANARRAVPKQFEQTVTDELLLALKATDDARADAAERAALRQESIERLTAFYKRRAGTAVEKKYARDRAEQAVDHAIRPPQEGGNPPAPKTALPDTARTQRGEPQGLAAPKTEQQEPTAQTGEIPPAPEDMDELLTAVATGVEEPGLAAAFPQSLAMKDRVGAFQERVSARAQELLTAVTLNADGKTYAGDTEALHALARLYNWLYRNKPPTHLVRDVMKERKRLLHAAREVQPVQSAPAPVDAHPATPQPAAPVVAENSTAPSKPPETKTLRSLDETFSEETYRDPKLEAATALDANLRAKKAFILLLTNTLPSDAEANGRDALGLLATVRARYADTLELRTALYHCIERIVGIGSPIPAENIPKQVVYKTSVDKVLAAIAPLFQKRPAATQTEARPPAQSETPPIAQRVAEIVREKLVQRILAVMKANPERYSAFSDEQKRAAATMKANEQLKHFQNRNPSPS